MDRFVVRRKRTIEESVDDDVKEQREEKRQSVGVCTEQRVKPADHVDSKNQENHNSENREYGI